MSPRRLVPLGLIPQLLCDSNPFGKACQERAKKRLTTEAPIGKRSLHVIMTQNRPNLASNSRAIVA